MPTLLEYMFDHPIYLIVLPSGTILLLLMILLYTQLAKSKRKQEKSRMS